MKIFLKPKATYLKLEAPLCPRYISAYRVAVAGGKGAPLPRSIVLP